jgi:hypothetical protein
VHFRPAVVACLVVLTAGCSHGATSPAPSASPSPSPSPSAALAALAIRASAATYSATYLAQSSDNPPRSSTITVYRTPTHTRLDVTETGGLVRIQVDPSGTYTCNVPTTGTPSCLTLAAGAAPVPANLDPSGQDLFTTTLDVLAKGTDLTVTTAPSQPATSAVPSSQCFAVNAGTNAGAASGTYCFTATGLVARAQFRSNILQLTAVGTQPAAGDFTLPASPVAVPSPATSPGASSS